jgi:hypothetical protein
MPNEHLETILSIPAAELPQRSQVRLEILADVVSLHLHFARSVADEIKARNAADQPTRLWA